ncbi:MAG: bifunctional methylenetetrahydrofolate dehydrogenase/methenyltetrahydrofolate cyclohydrolase FolD [Myxococcales bacterium]|nr:MAG: bifunctional methylenetetrahydrofolate dehydrogenase/methenyltetrahydrofolate cyclohydrolase FolD [Myxococcales bacterium]
MSRAAIIDGRARAGEVRADVARRIAGRVERGLRPPGLVTVLAGDDPASKVYVGNKQRAAGEVGMFSEHVDLPADTPQERLLEIVAELNARDDIDGILVQLPLPAGLDSERTIVAIDPDKDADGLHPVSQGRLFTGRVGVRPCTPQGCIDLIDTTGTVLEGRHAVVIGRSVLVGKPVAIMLLERDATVVVCHSRTRDLAAHIGRADVVVAAVGVPGLVRGEWIKPGAVVIDVGMNRVDGKLTGDVEFAVAAERASYITPVPGGVGPMTVAMLLHNTLEACERHDCAEIAT